MKNFLALSVAAVALALLSNLALAQTCASPTPLTSAQNLSGNTCGGDSTITNFCGGVQPTGPSNVYSYVAGASVSGNISVTPTNPFNVALGVVSGGANCNAALSSNCNGVSDSAGDGAANGTETFALSNTSTSGTTYYLIVTSLSGTAANQCGAYNLSMGTLPVTLQKFSVK